jgi:hypothetical protein
MFITKNPMKTTLLALLVTFALLLRPATALPAPSATVNAPEEILGAVGTYLPLVARSKQETWEVVKVVTDQFSGTATPSGLANISGSYSVIHQLGGSGVNASGRYSWPEPSISAGAASLPGRPDPARSSWLESTLFAYKFDGKMPQSATRYLLCILHEDSVGQDKFTDVHLIPNGWQDDVLPAVRYLRTHPKLSDPTTTASWIQARSLLRDANPYLVVTALQLLAASKNLQSTDMNAALFSSDTKVIACSIAVWQIYAASGSDQNTQWLMSQVTATSSLNQLEGVALGILASSPFTRMDASYPVDLPNLPDATKSPVSHDNSLETSLMPIVRQKLKELDPNGIAADEQWYTIDSICRLFGA